MNLPEFSRNVRADTIGLSPRPLRIEADAAEREALARRLGLAALERLEADVTLARADEDIVVSGRIFSEAVQSCVVTGAPVPVRIDQPFSILFRTEPSDQPADEEIELGEEELDVIFYEGAMVDVGEAAAQTLALSLEPFPRAPDAEGVLAQAGVQDEAQAGPFGALKALKDKLGG